MANVRVYDLAKELKVSNHDLMTALANLGVQVKSHASTLDAETIEKVKAVFKKNGGSSPASKSSSGPRHSTGPRKEIKLPPHVSVRELADLLGVPTSEVQKALVKQGALVAVNQVVNPELATKVAESFHYAVALPTVIEEPAKPKAAAPKEKEEEKPKAEELPKVQPKPKPKPRREAVLTHRPPIVTILGHVDHGKTTLLDAIRKTNVTEQEFGGITQHVGAYQVEVKGKKITFIDTPGHAAFTAMRARGAQVTDIVVLVVAADDGVMPQTVEALDHAKAAGVQIIVAINKIDKPDADLPRVKQQLAEHNLVVEEWGGETVSVDISAKNKLNLDDLLDMILLVAELAEFKADASGPVEATVIEAKMDKGRGPVATVLVDSGTLKRGDSVLVGQAYGRIKAMVDDRGHKMEKAGPSTPVEIVGLSTVPLAGDKLEVMKNEREARQIAEGRKEDERTERFDSAAPKVTLADLYKALQEGIVKDLNVILKADVQGTEEAVADSLKRLSTEEVRVNLIHSGVGNVSESDVLLASASNAVVVGFNVRVEPQVKRTAEAEHVDIHLYNVIYELLDEVKAAMEGLLEPILEEVVVGHAEVRQIFRLPKGGVVAGSYVTDGKAQRNAQARVLRGGEALFTGKVGSLKHIKEDVREMAAGFECGITLDGFTAFEVGDVVEFFIIEEKVRRI
ncbi:MAG: translation initiation factor IF-2 [Armatimonadota bacterium]